MDWEIYWVDALNHPWQVPGDPRLSSAHEVAGYHILLFSPSPLLPVS
jgi:hypothetical protein